MTPPVSSKQHFRPSVRRALLSAFWCYYEALGFFVAVSLVFSLGFLVVFYLLGKTDRWAVAILIFFLFYLILALLNSWSVRKALKIMQPAIDGASDLPVSHTRYIIMALAQMFFTPLLIQSPLVALIEKNTLFAIISAPFIYLSLFWAATFLYQWPFIIIGNSGVFISLKRSCLVTLDNLLYSFALLAVSIITVALLLLTGIGAVAALGGLLSCIQAAAYCEVMKKYPSGADYHQKSVEEPQVTGD